MGNVADGIVDRLRAWGTHRVFGYAGDGVDPLLAALARAEEDIEFVSARHEEMAAFMATGHAKYTGQVGVCLATQGPGAIHLLAGLYDAKLDSKPVVAIVGQVVTTAQGSGYQQEVELPTLFKDVCAQYVQTVNAPEQVEAVLDNAFRTAIATSSPTCVIVAHDVQQAEVPEKEHTHGIVPSAPVTAAPRVMPSEEDLDRAARLLNTGERVALLVGQGAAGAASEVAKVAERLGAGVATSLLGKPVIDESLPWACGVMGHLGTTAAANLMAGCDTLLIVGSNDPWTEFYPAPGQARAVQIDISARNLGAKYPVEVALAGDATETLRALLPRLQGTERPWRGEVETMVDTWRRVAQARCAEPAEPLNPQAVVAALSDHLPADAQVSVDVGSVVYWYARFLRLPPEVPAHLSSTLACMGSAMPYGLAAKLAHPDRPVVALAGDGAMQMSGNAELITLASRWRDWTDPRFVVLVLSNGDLAEVSWEQREMEGDPRFPASQDVPAFPWADHARLLGLEGIRIDRPEDIDKAWATALSADRPTVIEAVVDPATPLLPPRATESQVEQMLTGLAQEGADRAAEQLRIQREHEEARHR
ncbi:thiamine pyrophosphate-requiring protein [Kocuria sp. CNJ-770]|uniref:thiamine pyrophosphate-requiring protein n=1 Tax=Kocuria sp. CNJ-770 TaxID=1904964 RepID=UPI00095B9D01|nr:thiamine pyrophosphate-requiring protein [Kocuria sp. CNJ-770]OLT14285.1 thiamine pyrophosphate-requiring protein [Kocuria sp. CNJ-770]